jgi:hypothetical protein
MNITYDTGNFLALLRPFLHLRLSELGAPVPHRLLGLPLIVLFSPACRFVGAPAVPPLTRPSLTTNIRNCNNTKQDHQTNHKSLFGLATWVIFVI